MEDDHSIVSNLTRYLCDEGFTVETAGVRRKRWKSWRPDSTTGAAGHLLPDGSGYAVCAAAKANSDLPVIFLTASGDEYSVVAGLDMGADDYISKPFRPRELLSRIRSVLRRSGKSQTVLEVDHIRVDTEKGNVTRHGEEVFLSALEYRLLLVFFANKGLVLSRSRLLEEIWDAAGEYVNDNTLTVYIKRLRDKLEDDPQNPTFIKTIRGIGYKIGH